MVDSRAIATGILASAAFWLVPIPAPADEVVPPAQIVASISDEQAELVDEVSIASELASAFESACPRFGQQRRKVLRCPTLSLWVQSVLCET